MKILAVLLTLICLSSASLAQEKLFVPGRPDQSADGTGGWSYWLARKVVLDVDQMLKSQGIQAEFCTYRNLQTQKDSSYKGMGPCLFENFKKSMKTDDLVGVIYAWILDKDQNHHPIEIRWRPPRGGWLKVIRQVIEMRFEKPLYFVRSFFGSEEFANKLRYEEFLGGEMNIVLPEDAKAIKALIASGNPWLIKYAQNVRDIGFSLKASEALEGKVVYQGQLQMSMRSSEGEAQANFDIKTNINILLLDRKFFAKGHLRSGDLKTGPQAPQEALP